MALLVLAATAPSSGSSPRSSGSGRSSRSAGTSPARAATVVTGIAILFAGSVLMIVGGYLAYRDDPRDPRPCAQDGHVLVIRHTGATLHAASNEGGAMKLKIVIGLVVVVLAVVAVVLLTGATTTTRRSRPGDTPAKPDGQVGRRRTPTTSDATTDADDDEPELRTVAVKRSAGKDAAVNVGALMRKPEEIWLRVSSAPKQKVTVNWTLACGVGATAQGDYDVTPPDTRQLELPKKNPKTCVASASTQIDGKGRREARGHARPLGRDRAAAAPATSPVSGP